MTCTDVELRRKTFKTMHKLRKWSNWIASIWSQNEQKCWVTSQNIQNNAKLQKWSKYNDLHRFELRRKTSKQRKTTIKL